jgi:hypothetical protein
MNIYWRKWFTATWLLIFSIFCINAVVASTSSYDERDWTIVAYDGSGESPFNYDSFVTLTANEEKNKTVVDCAFFCEIAEFLAADSGSVWNLGWGSRGFTIEQQLGGNLPASFPVIDSFDFASGTATSIKSIDLSAASYQNTAILTSRLNSYVDSVAGFNGANWADVDIQASQITARQLNLAIPSGSASAAQQAAINAAAARAQGMDVNLIVTPIP